jgi:hypothetical protein
MMAAMTLPNEPVNLSVAQISELNQKLVNLRHDVNNHLSLIAAATELIRRSPESAGRLSQALVEQPQKISGAITQFTRDLEAALGITRS